MREVVVTVREEGQRLDHFLAKYLDHEPKGFFYKMLRKKNIVLNGKKAVGKERLKTGDRIRLYLSEQTIEKFRTSTAAEGENREPFSFPEEFHGLSVIYEDEQILVVNKPAGVLSQKAKAEDVSLVEWLQAYLSEELGAQNVFKAGICNRLDRNTTGLVVSGKTVAALQYLNRLFKERELKKYYLCLVKGNVEKEQRIEGYLSKSERNNQVTVSKHQTENAVWIETAYSPKEHFMWKGKAYTLLCVHLITGRPHQIRAHLASIGHPVIGDLKYGEKEEAFLFRKDFGVRYQLLHAWKLVLSQAEYLPEKYHGTEWTAPLPEQFEAVLIKIREET